MAKTPLPPLAKLEDEVSLRLWLTGQSREVAVALAVRSALRVAPALFGLRAWGGRERSTAWLPLLRGMAMPWVATRYPACAGLVRAEATTVFAGDAANFAYKGHRSNPIFDAAAAAASAAAFAVESTSGADDAAALDTSSSSAAAAASFSAGAVKVAAEASDGSAWNALADDMAALAEGVIVTALLDRPLWAIGEPETLARKRIQWVDHLLRMDEGWDHWLHWLNDRFLGRPADEEKEIARLTLPEELWSGGVLSIDGVKAVNAEIARRFAEIDERRRQEAATRDLGEPVSEPAPDVPNPEAGVAFRFGEGGLHLARSAAVAGANRETQTKLHARLQGLVAQLLDHSVRASNHHPGIAALVREYASLIDVPFGEIDAIDLWAVGAGLQGFVAAYDPGAAGRTMSGPLEPEHYAKLVQVARVHAGFVLGFDDVEKTVERGLRFAQENAEIVAEIGEPQGRLLHELAGQSKWIDAAARELISAIDVAYTQFGWRVAETGYAAFGALKNGLLEVSKAVVVIDDLFTGVVGKGLRKALDAEKILAIAAAYFLRDHAVDILAFARPLPELRDWFFYVIDHLEARDRRSGPEN